jgi:rRNA-processing protein FCF1
MKLFEMEIADLQRLMDDRAHVDTHLSSLCDNTGRLMDAFAQCLSLHPIECVSGLVHERLWKHAFYKPIESMKRALKKEEGDVQRFVSFTDYAVGCYLVTLEILMRHASIQHAKLYDDVVEMNERNSVALLVQKCAVFIGDLNRYKESVTGVPANLSTWWYNTAIHLFPHGGKPYSQLGVVATIHKKVMDAMYWYACSLATAFSAETAHDNLTTLLGKFLLNAATRTENSSEYWFTLWLASAYLHPTKRVEERIYHSNQLAQHPLSHDQRFKMICMVCCMFWTSERDFTRTTDTTHKVAIRLTQIELITIGLKLLVLMFDQSQDVFSLALWSDFCLKNMDTIVKCLSFSQKEAQDRNLQPAFKAYHQAFCKWYAATDLVHSQLPYDKQCVGLQPFYKHSTTINDPLRYPQAALYRIHMATMAFVSLPCFDLAHVNGTFTLIDPMDRKKDKKKMMKAMASQRLHHQVATLEANLERMGIRTDHDELPLLIPDALVWIHRLERIQSLVSRQECIVVILSSVLQDLDKRKKGMDKENRQARHVMRWLDDMLKSKNRHLLSSHDELVSVIQQHPHRPIQAVVHTHDAQLATLLRPLHADYITLSNWH